MSFDCVRDARIVKTQVSGLKSVRQLESTVTAEAVWNWLRVGVRLAATLLFAERQSTKLTSGRYCRCWVPEVRRWTDQNLFDGDPVSRWAEVVHWRFQSAVELKIVRWGVCLRENEADSSGCWTTYLSLSPLPFLTPIDCSSPFP